MAFRILTERVGFVQPAAAGPSEEPVATPALPFFSSLAAATSFSVENNSKEDTAYVWFSDTPDQFVVPPSHAVPMVPESSRDFVFQGDFYTGYLCGTWVGKNGALPGATAATELAIIKTVQVCNV